MGDVWQHYPRPLDPTTGLALRLHEGDYLFFPTGTFAIYWVVGGVEYLNRTIVGPSHYVHTGPEYVHIIPTTTSDTQISATSSGITTSTTTSTTTASQPQVIVHVTDKGLFPNPVERTVTS